MYLHRSITDRDENPFEMVGAVDGMCTFSGHLVRFGYLEVAGVNTLPKTGVTQGSEMGYNDKDAENILKSMVGLRGHEFHYYESSRNGEALKVCKPDRGPERNCIICENNGIWGFPHFYYPSAPEFVNCFVLRMKEVRSGKLQ